MSRSLVPTSLQNLQQQQPRQPNSAEDSFNASGPVFIQSEVRSQPLVKATPLVDIVAFVEAARFIPDCCNITKVVVSFFDKTGKIVADRRVEKLLRLGPDIFSPSFKAKIELSRSEYQPEAGLWLFVELYSFEAGEKLEDRGFSLCAYSLLPVLVQDGTLRDPLLADFSGLVLNAGEFQVPFYSARQTREDFKDLVLDIE